MKFEVDTVRLIEEVNNSQFATIEVDICRSGNNSHRMVITKEAIKLAASTIKGKPVLAKYYPILDELGGHEPDEQAVGFFIDEEPSITERDGELWITAKAKIWKNYFGYIMGIFEKKDGVVPVSMEINVLEGIEPEQDKDGEISVMVLEGLTLLGVKPAIKEAEARVLSFSEIKDSYYKEQHFEERRDEDSMEEEKVVVEVKEEPEQEEIKGEMACGGEAEMACGDKAMECEGKEEMACDKMEEAEEEEKEEVKDEVEEEEKEVDDEEDKEEEKYAAEEETENEFLIKIQNEPEEIKSIVTELYATKDVDIIMEKFVDLLKERNELAQFKCDRLEQDKIFAVEKILSEVKDDIDVEKFAELQAEGRACDNDGIDAFANKVKAFAYEATKDKKVAKKSNNIIKMGVVVETKTNEPITAESIFEKYGCKIVK